jgi:hypothetical protein
MYEHVYVVGHATPEPQDPNFQLDFIDAFKLPEGYLEYFQELGRGEFCNWVNVFTQQELIERHQFWLSLLKGRLWWDENLFSREAAKNSILLAESGEGSRLIFHPMTETFYFSDRGSGQVHSTQGSLLDALRLYMLPDTDEPIKLPYFTPEPYLLPVFTYCADSDEISYEELEQAILDFGIHSDASRDDYTSRFTVPDVLGIIELDDVGEIVVSLCCDKKANPTLLDTIIRNFETMGLSDYYCLASTQLESEKPILLLTFNI